MIEKRGKVFGCGDEMVFEKANLIRLRATKEKNDIIEGKTNLKEGLREYKLANAEIKISHSKFIMESIRLPQKER